MAVNIRIVASVVVGTCAFAAWAGPEFDEGGTDAGNTPPTSKAVSSSSGASVTTVRGKTTGTALLGGADAVDLYRIKIGSDPFAFKVDMNMIAGGSPSWGARLVLFRKVVVACQAATGVPVYYDFARPIATSVKKSPAASYPVLDGSVVCVGDTSGNRLGNYLTANTEYYLAVCGANEYPQGIREDCGAGSIKTFFQGSTGFGQYLASSEDAGYHLTTWNGGGVTGGEYGMGTGGINAVAASSCSSAMTIVGSDAAVPFDYAVAPQVDLPGVSCAPTWRADRQFFYVWEPQCTGTATVRSCGLSLVDTALEVFAIDPCNPDPCAAASTSSIACNDQCGSANASVVTFAITAGSSYLVWMPRVSLFGTGTTGTVQFTCASAPPSGDVNGDGVVNAIDLSIMLGQWSGQ